MARSEAFPYGAWEQGDEIGGEIAEEHRAIKEATPYDSAVDGPGPYADVYRAQRTAFRLVVELDTKPPSERTPQDIYKVEDARRRAHEQASAANLRLATAKPPLDLEPDVIYASGSFEPEMVWSQAVRRNDIR